MKTTQSKALDFTMTSIIELNENRIIDVIGGSNFNGMVPDSVTTRTSIISK